MSKSITTALACDWPDCAQEYEYGHTVARARRDAAEHGWGRLAGTPLNPKAPTGPPAGCDFCPDHASEGAVP